MRWGSKHEPEWGRWYAWYPVRIDRDNLGSTFVWLEWIERRTMYTWGGSYHEYRETV